jgi:hypothetical protein
MADESLAKKIADSSNDAIVMMAEDGLRIAESFRLPLGTERDCGGARRSEIENYLGKRGYHVDSEATIVGVSASGTPVYSRDLIIGRQR